MNHMHNINFDLHCLLTRARPGPAWPQLGYNFAEIEMEVTGTPQADAGVGSRSLPLFTLNPYLVPYRFLSYRLPTNMTSRTSTALKRLMTEYKQLTAGGPFIGYFMLDQTR